MTQAMMKFKRVTIVGLGCIGGSLGMALRRHRLSREVVGLSRRAATVRRARQRGAIDWGTTDAARAVHGADVMVLATPVGTIVPYAKRLSRLMKPGAILTDVGSTKAAIVSTLEPWCARRRVAFVGAHPLAGSDQRGIEAAQRDLFAGSICVLTPTPRTNRHALARVQRVWRPLVGRVVVLSPSVHDRRLALVSHLPHVVAFSLVASAEAEARAIAPRSFLDATRVAKSDPALWRDILLTNRASVRRAIQALQRRLTAFDRQLARQDAAALTQLLRHAQRLRHSLDS